VDLGRTSWPWASGPGHGKPQQPKRCGEERGENLKKPATPCPPTGQNGEGGIRTRRLTRKQVQNGRGGVPEVHHKKVPSARPIAGPQKPYAFPLPHTLPFRLSRATNALCAPNRYLGRYLITIKPLEKLGINAVSMHGTRAAGLKSRAHPA
jgi:hypothetical protein